ncbi:hypothetical protein PUN28_004967 [Cardiocondyla obscurior]|uniref:Secreted protein n=1 Tax=Cardiocondyla obscurior TaxID=286306 RepID=A0AAW2GDB4_9HYME
MKSDSCITLYVFNLNRPYFKSLIFFFFFFFFLPAAFIIKSFVENNYRTQYPVRSRCGGAHKLLSHVRQFKTRERTADEYLATRLSNVTSLPWESAKSFARRMTRLGSTWLEPHLAEDKSRCEIHATINRETMIARRPAPNVCVARRTTGFGNPRDLR